MCKVTSRAVLRIVWTQLVLMLYGGAALAQDSAKTRRKVEVEGCPEM
jgi:hypothetical protein